MSDLWTDLLACFELNPVTERDAGKSEGSRAPDLVVEGRNQQLSYHRVFGGQLLGQFILAANSACPDKSVKSLHALFPKEGNAAEPVRYEVDRHHAGRSFATLSIIARQPHGVIGTASISMHAAEDGHDRQTNPTVPAVPGPEHAVEFGMLPWVTRTIDDLDSPEPATAEFDLWMRTPPVDAALAAPLLAYGTDLTLIGTALRPVAGVTQLDSGTAFVSAVTSHTLWFHRPFRTDEWVLLHQHSPIAAHGRCFGRGDVLTENGDLVASYSQEALLRFTN